ncbi:MAG TPA: CHAP domain-containing protein [Ktedonobacteraceae bacterium]|nr:CHAP domain-containing protein [Ktedonobacteraceae bacterium]
MLFAKRPAAAGSQANTPALPVEQSPTTPMQALAASPTAGLITSSDARMITGTLSSQGSTIGRAPIIIKGGLKRSEPLPPPSRQARRKHSKRLWILGMTIVIVTLAVTLLGLTPEGQELTAKFSNGPMASSGTVISHQQNNSALAPAALATTTWMYQNDGYDPYSHGEVNVSDGTSSLPWPYGQCTYWANYRYHQMTGFWVQWTGNADQWFLGAQKAGWDYGQTPPPDVPSIIVLMPYVQQAGGVGHVAVVESVSGNVVHTSNMNWGYGGWTHTEQVDFTLGSGVYFVWHKPAN